MAQRTIKVILHAQIEDYKRQMALAAAATNKIPESVARADTALGRMVQSARYNRESWDRAGQTMVGFGAATLAGLGLAVNAAIQWESAWTGVLKTVDGTEAQLSALEGSLREMARTLPATHQEIAAVAEAAGQLGVATPAVAGFTRTMIDLSETTNLTADEAATNLAQLMNVMGTSADEVDNLGSAVVALGNDGASTERDIVLMAQRIAGAGAIIGLTEGEVLGLANALSSVGIEVEAGGSAISRIMIDVAKAVSTGSADLGKFAEVAGMSAEEFATAFRSDPSDAIATFVEGLGRLNAAGGDVFTTLSELGQTDIRVTNALLTLSNSGDLLRESLELGNNAWADNNALMIEAAKRYDTAAARMEVAKNSINDAAISLGEAFIPMVADAADGVAGLAGWLADLPTPVQQAAGGLAAIAGSASLATGGFLLLFPRVMDTVNAFKTLRADGSRIPGVLGSIGKAAAALTVAATLLTIADAAQAASISTEELANRLIAVEAGSAGIESLFADIGQGWADDLRLAGDRLDVGSVDDFSRALKNLAETPDWFGQDFVNMMNDIAGLDGGLRQLGVRLRAAGNEIGLVAQTDLPRAQAQFRLFAEAAGGGDEAIRNLLEQMQPYEAALYAAATAQDMTLTEAELLALATGDLAIGSAEAAAGLEALAGRGAYVLAPIQQTTAATEEAAAAVEEWRASLAGAYQAFIDLPSAFQAAIDANTAFAEAAAASSGIAGDAWTNYYDGQTVTGAQWIAQLQAQVDAQAAWATNIEGVTARVAAELPAEMHKTAYAMIDELAALGPEGAAQIALLNSMSKDEFKQVVTLYGQKGAEAGASFVSRVEGMRRPSVQVNVRMADNAQAVLDRFFSANANRTIGVRVSGSGSFDTGGYTGDLPTNAVAGVVHGREMVINAPATARNRPLLEAINSGATIGVRGYGDGGYVQPASGAGTFYAPSLALPSSGWSITGRLAFDGDGFMRLIDGRLSQSQAARTATATQGVR